MLPETKLDIMLARHASLEAELSGQLPAETYVKLTRELAEIAPVVEKVKAYRHAVAEMADLDHIIADPATDADMRGFATEERPLLARKRDALEHEIRLALIPKDAMDDRNVILEIRAGTGGDEAALFAGDLYRMYERYATIHGWKAEIISASEGTKGGYKEIIAEVRGRGAFAKLKFESGVHRVQRVPDTEGSGRIHTSAATVAVLPEVEDIDIAINDTDLRIDTMRAQGAGGQHVNKTEFGGPDHPPSVRHRRDDAGGALAAPQPGESDVAAAGQALRRRAAKARYRAGGEPARPGRQRRPLRAHPHL